MTDASRPDRHGPAARPRCLRPGHGLLTGKVVVVTAAAGTGIGFATAKRCVEEGATVVVSDAHERRLGRGGRRPGRAARGRRGVDRWPCPAT